MSPANSFLNNTPQPSPQTSGVRRIIRPQIIFLGLGIIILIELFIAYRTFQQTPSVGTEILPKSLAPLGEGKIALTSDRGEFKVGEEFPVVVRVFTGGYVIDGVDLVLKYDPSELEATSSSILQGGILNNYPEKSVDKIKGLIKISAISSISGSGFNGVGNFATINFKGVSKGETHLQVEFAEGNTADTNIIKQKSGEDILKDGAELSLNITTNGGPPASDNLGCGPRVYHSCLDSEDRSGTYWCSSLQEPIGCQIGCFKDETTKEEGCNIITN